MSEVRTLPRERAGFAGMTNFALRNSSVVREMSEANFFGDHRARSVGGLMGSLVKKRRKRMRKKKHRKMLKRTRFQRRAAGK